MVGNVAVHIGHDQVLGGVYPLALGLAQVVNAMRAQHGQEAFECVAGLEGGIAQGDGVLRPGRVKDNGPVTRAAHRLDYVRCAFYFDALLADFGCAPLALVFVAIRRVKALDVQVLVVRAGMGDGPGDALVVSEMREGRHAGERDANDVECILRVGASEMILVIDVRHINRPVWVAGQERLAAARFATVHDPVVAAVAGG